MFNFLKSKETKRIEYLLRFYQNSTRTGLSKEEATMNMWGELITRGEMLKDRYGFAGRDFDSRKVLLKEMFSPLEVSSYDFHKAIEFIVAWEFPNKYNERTTVENIRSGTNARSVLKKKVKQLASSFLS